MMEGGVEGRASPSDFVHTGKNSPFPDTDASLVFFRCSGRGGDMIFTSAPAFSTPDLVPVGVAIGALQKTALRRR